MKNMSFNAVLFGLLVSIFFLSSVGVVGIFSKAVSARSIPQSYITSSDADVSKEELASLLEQKNNLITDNIDTILRLGMSDQLIHPTKIKGVSYGRCNPHRSLEPYDSYGLSKLYLAFKILHLLEAEKDDDINQYPLNIEEDIISLQNMLNRMLKSDSCDQCNNIQNKITLKNPKIRQRYIYNINQEAANIIEQGYDSITYNNVRLYIEKCYPEFSAVQIAR